ncbi:Chloride channel protein 2 [Halotydeus destructor]|nr:Chloride channel protein 2 [Halotydeus destructor]
MAGRSEGRRASVMEYEQSVIFGQYHEKLASFARLQAKNVQKSRIQERLEFDEEDKPSLCRPLLAFLTTLGNWPLLILLGLIISFLSFAVDVATHHLLEIRNYLMATVPESTGMANMAVWAMYTVTMVMVAAIICRYISPQASGAGVAEMKVIIRGVVIKEYLDFRTLIAKIIGVPFTLASNLGLGKEGPFVHISSMVTNQLFKLFSPVTVTPNEYESRFQELITIAAAVGVAATFAAPIGSVLYSIEIVKSFFAVRSYWEGFFAATIGALLWRLFAVWFNIEQNISHILQTQFRSQYPYETIEIVLFAILGLTCGLISYFFVQFQRSIVKFNRRKNCYNRFINRFPLIYPLGVATFIAMIKYPFGIGKYTSSYHPMEYAMHDLFSNFTWGTFETTHYHLIHEHESVANVTHDLAHQIHIIQNWSSADSSIFVNTLLFVISNFFTVALASTVPIPGGLIVPLFFIGAGFGRFFGEWAAHMFPYGMNPMSNSPAYMGIVPGAYAVAASAAMCGGVTGSLSVAVIAFEITGQLTHFLPVIVCVLCANLVARYLGPTIYESTIELKNLPFLPTMIKAATLSHKVLVEDFMETDVLYIWKGCTFRTLNDMMKPEKRLAFYPFVSGPDSKFLLGIIHHLELKHLLDNHLYRSGLKGGTMKDENGSAQVSPQVTFNGRFQIWSNFGPYKVNYKDKDQWDESLDDVVDFKACHIDPAPLQIMEGTPLANIHNLFSLLSLQVVYVTSLGRLTGVVALKDLRKVIDTVERGESPNPRLNRELKTVGTISEETEPLDEDNNQLTS